MTLPPDFWTVMGIYGGITVLGSAWLIVVINLLLKDRDARVGRQ